MLVFPAQESVEVYASNTGWIVFKSYDENSEEVSVFLTIEQFEMVIAKAPELIKNAQASRGDF
jgi:hypothetical protein